MKFWHLVLLTNFFLTLSCCKSLVKDYSLTPEEYRDLDMPDYAMAWNYSDYEQTCVILSNLKVIKPLSLPRKYSKKSGEYFNRMVNPVNLSFWVDENLTLREKAFRIQKYIKIQKCLIGVYTDLNNKEQYYNHELIDLYIFGLTIAQNMLDLGQLINESVDNGDIELQNGFRSIQYMYLTMVILVLENQQKSYFFEKEDLERLSEFVYNSVMINREWIEDAPAKDIKQQAEKVVAGTSSKKIKNIYLKLIDIL